MMIEFEKTNSDQRISLFSLLCGVNLGYYDNNLETQVISFWDSHNVMAKFHLNRALVSKKAFFCGVPR